MKKILILLAFIGIAFTGCNPVEDINNDIPNQIVEGTDEFTMTTEDYENIVDQGNDEEPDFYEMFEVFRDVDDAKAMLPGFLSDRYPFWGDGSSVTVNYNLLDGNPEDAGAFARADVYDLTLDDYSVFEQDAFGLLQDVDATEVIPVILTSEIEMPEEGQTVLAEYKQFVEAPVVGFGNLFEASFPNDFGDFELVSVTGLDELGWTEDDAFIVGSGWNGMANTTEEWLISEEINLNGVSDVLFQVTQEIDFLGDPALIDVLVSTNYTTGEDVSAATWVAIDFDKTAFGSMTASEDLDFSDYDGETIHVALKYSSTDSDSPRWRVESFSIKKLGLIAESDSRGEYFAYEGGSWEPVEDIYYLSASDYDSMGEGSGQPGRFNNFSSSVRPENYLPQFLNMQYPFAQEEDALFVAYKYFFGGDIRTITRGNLYTFTNGEWIQSTATLQLGLNNGIWVPDNTIRYTLTGGDYALVVTELADVEGFESAVSNLDNFGNFNRTGTWTDEMIITALNVILDNIDPSAEELQKYVVTIATWAPGNSTEDWEMIKYEGEWITQALYAELTQ